MPEAVNAHRRVDMEKAQTIKDGTDYEETDHIALDPKCPVVPVKNLCGCNITMDFIKAGKAVFTADNGKDTHYTYKVTKKEDGDRVMWFVNLLTGPDNTSNYTYMGMLVHRGDEDSWYGDIDSWYCKMTRASKFYCDSKPVKVLNWVLDVIQGHNELPSGYSIQHDGRCARCARVLTDPVSIKLGLGPICRDQGY